MSFEMDLSTKKCRSISLNTEFGSFISDVMLCLGKLYGCGDRRAEFKVPTLTTSLHQRISDYSIFRHPGAICSNSILDGHALWCI